MTEIKESYTDYDNTFILKETPPETFGYFFPEQREYLFYAEYEKITKTWAFSRDDGENITRYYAKDIEYLIPQLQDMLNRLRELDKNELV